jgi:hypothetical protein
MLNKEHTLGERFGIDTAVTMEITVFWDVMK